VNNTECDQLRRELKIAAASARKLSVALDIAWAVLTRSRGFAPMGGSEKAVPPVPIKNQAGPEVLPFPEDPFE